MMPERIDPISMQAEIAARGDRDLLPNTTAGLFAFVDIPGRDLWWQGVEKMRVTFRVRKPTRFTPYGPITAIPTRSISAHPGGSNCRP
jgi:hypothetical protein